jgi:putative flippase GtrA
LLEFLEFSGGRVASLIIQEAIFLLAVDIMNFEPEPVKLFSAVFVVIINYVFCKLVFAKGASETRKRKKKD